MSDRKQIQAGKDSDTVQPGNSGTSDKAPDEQRFPSGVDQGFVYYEE
jgi:hypothetical protein